MPIAFRPVVLESFRQTAPAPTQYDDPAKCLGLKSLQFKDCRILFARDLIENTEGNELGVKLGNGKISGEGKCVKDDDGTRYVEVMVNEDKDTKTVYNFTRSFAKGINEGTIYVHDYWKNIKMETGALVYFGYFFAECKQ